MRDAAYQPGRAKNEIIVGQDVWIGYGTIVLGGVNIGKGAVIGAGAVVTKDVRPYSIAVGNPAREVGCRFDSNEIRMHEAIIAERGGA
jgi:acetyltransferase-like isoleucine patch superfamily enzyme